MKNLKILSATFLLSVPFYSVSEVNVFPLVQRMKMCQKMYNQLHPMYKVLGDERPQVEERDWNIPVENYQPLNSESVPMNNRPAVQEPAEMPLNPCGRTGVSGRGFYWNYGPNYAADPIVTRFNPVTGQLEMAAVYRADTGDAAIPGGMIDKKNSSVVISTRLTDSKNFAKPTVASDLEDAEETAKRELNEEFGSGLLEFIKDVQGKLVYEGIVDDSRATDNAWPETKAYHYHISNENSLILQKMTLSTNDIKEVKGVFWMPVTEDNLNMLFASHGSLVRQAIKDMPLSVEPFAHN